MRWSVGFMPASRPTQQASCMTWRNREATQYTTLRGFQAWFQTSLLELATNNPKAPSFLPKTQWWVKLSFSLDWFKHKNSGTDVNIKLLRGGHQKSKPSRSSPGRVWDTSVRPEPWCPHRSASLVLLPFSVFDAFGLFHLFLLPGWLLQASELVTFHPDLQKQTQAVLSLEGEYGPGLQWQEVSK